MVVIDHIANLANTFGLGLKDSPEGYRGLAAAAATVDANFRWVKVNRCREWLWALCGYNAELGVPEGVPYAGFEVVMEALYDFGARAAAGDGDFADLDDTAEYIYWRLVGAIDPQNEPF